MDFLVHSYSTGERTSTIRVERTGTVLLFEKSMYGEVIRSEETSVDPNYAGWLINQIEGNFGQIPTGNPNENIGLGYGLEPPAMQPIGGVALPPAVEAGLTELRNLRDTLRNQFDQQHGYGQASPRPAGEMDWTEAVIAGFGMFVGHTAITFLILLLVGLGLSEGGLGALALLVGGILVGVGAFYVGAGYYVGRVATGNPERTAGWAALIAIILNIVVTLVVSGEFGGACAVWVLPWLARFGATSGAQSRGN